MEKAHINYKKLPLVAQTMDNDRVFVKNKEEPVDV